MSIIKMSIVNLLLCISIYSNNRNSSKPFISGDSFRALADHLYDETSANLSPDSVQKKDIIFIKTDFLASFFKNIHPYILNPYIIVTHNSDLEAPGNFQHYLNDPKIVHWFGMNPSIRHPKFTPIPIGIANQCWSHGKVSDFKTVIESLPLEKKHLLVLNFEVVTNRTKRRPVFDLFSQQSFCTIAYDQNHIAYLMKMAEGTFVLSPEGNGLDCHRTWEALLVESIPLIRSSLLDPLFDDLPVVLINEWTIITEQFLQQAQLEVEHKRYNNKKAYFAYWENLILSMKQGNT